MSTSASIYGEQLNRSDDFVVAVIAVSPPLVSDDDDDDDDNDDDECGDVGMDLIFIISRLLSPPPTPPLLGIIILGIIKLDMERPFSNIDAD
ncbi:hypothetical protein DERF_013728 [Dermatophagoides farinae]|uniref:Uncharacterized protein n=1 Tax=Dermatophagoides farinae TaxID=6954 RepID=A0A922HS78_DERFA|nr:hypothetical protein DERF_013728 [Dermatophagoides farinae]